jgi:hypothetical protein
MSEEARRFRAINTNTKSPDHAKRVFLDFIVRGDVVQIKCEELSLDVCMMTANELRLFLQLATYEPPKDAP